MTPLSINDVVVCPHNGKVILNSNKGKSLMGDSIKAITQNDLLNSPIVGCTRTIAGVSVPCSKVVSVKSISNLLNINDDNIVLCEKLNLSLSDKGFALSLQNKPFFKNKINIE